MRDALPHASFIGFTGTPIELQDANTRAVFGDYISVYDIQRAVQDGATVPIYYESRLAKLALDEIERPRSIRSSSKPPSRGVERKEKLKSKWAQLEAVVGADERLELVARHIVEHFEKRCRQNGQSHESDAQERATAQPWVANKTQATMTSRLRSNHHPSIIIPLIVLMRMLVMSHHPLVALVRALGVQFDADAAGADVAAALEWQLDAGAP